MASCARLSIRGGRVDDALALLVGERGGAEPLRDDVVEALVGRLHASGRGQVVRERRPGVRLGVGVVDDALDVVEDVLEDGADQRLLGREPAIQRALADSGAARDLLDAHVEPRLGKGGARGIEDARAVAGGVGPQRADVELSIATILYPVRQPCEVNWCRPTPLRSVRGPMAVMAQTDERPWLDELNDEQRAAATFAGGPLLILAGAGTGKTTTLCARVAWLVSAGVPAERVLLLTFTRRAAREMLQRARGLVPASSRVLGGTFHSVAHRLVRRHAAALGAAGGVRGARRG